MNSQHTDSRTENTPVSTESTESGGNTSQGTMRADAQSDQKLTVNDGSALQGSEVTVAPGALAVDTTVTIAAGEDLTKTALVQAVQSGQEVEAAAPAVAVTAENPDALSGSIALAIPVPETASLTGGLSEGLVILFRTMATPSRPERTGILDHTRFTVDAGFARFTFDSFGTFQAVYLRQKQDTVADTGSGISDAGDGSGDLDGSGSGVGSGSVASVPPEFHGIDLGGWFSDQYLNIKEVSDNLDLVISVQGAGHDALGYAITTPGSNCESATFLAAIPKSTSPLLTDNDAFKVCLRLSNDAGTVYGHSTQFYVDKTPPATPEPSLQNSASDGYINQAESALATDLVGAESTGTGESAEYKIASTVGLCSQEAGYLSAVPKNSDLLSDGTFYVCVLKRDAAGNIATGASPAIVRDIQVPVISSVTLAAEATDGFINSAESGGSAPLVTATVSGASSTEFAVIADGGACDHTATGFSNDAPTSSASGLSDDGNFRICARAADQALNTSYMQSASIEVNISAPDAPGTPLITADAAGGSPDMADDDSTIFLQWNASSAEDVTSYTVTWFNGTNCSAGTQTEVENAASPLALTVAASGTYSFWVNAVDSAGNVSPVFGCSNDILVTLPPAGAPDSSFAGSGAWSYNHNNGTDYLYDLTTLSDGRIVAVGYMDGGAGSDEEYAIVILNADGSNDPFFNAGVPLIWGGTGTQKLWAVARDGNDNIFVAGSNQQTGTIEVFKMESDGTLITDFGSSGMVTLDPSVEYDEPKALAVDSSGNAYVCGYGNIMNMRWYAAGLAGSDGNILWENHYSTGLVTTTAVHETCNALAVNGTTLYAAGHAYDGTNGTVAAVAALNTSTGAFDTSFNTTGVKTLTIQVQSGGSGDRANAIAYDTSLGRIVIAGTSHDGTANDFFLARINTNGSLDTAFDTDAIRIDNGPATGSSANALAVDSNGKYLIAGTSKITSSADDYVIKRYLSSGADDASFGTAGVASFNVTTNDTFYAIALAPDGAIYAGGLKWTSTFDWYIRKVAP